VYESTDHIEKLQGLLDESYARAGAHLSAIHEPRWRMSAAQVCTLLQGVNVLHLATVSRSGTPFVAPVDGLFLRGLFWFGSGAQSLRFRHIRRNSRVSAAHTRGEEVSILVHGRAHEIDTGTGDYEYLHDYCREVYGTGYDDWGFWGEQPYAWIEPTHMYAVRMQHA
jgi:nitroimidazol reductase NimA-like FMN-containing flavoprotein (pyridoxamine 5'-phosphate oxidase superfamily)